ncbi:MULTISPECIES: DNA cytosine methyltransferase [unclassified Janthinobacterium]|nr:MULTISPECIES: DNA cytosine methyltransferase [unclassified Janthinobacterium]
MASVKDPHTRNLDLGHELLVDNFAGGGGTSTGLERAFGRPVDIAINHDPEAIAMHAMNHPRTMHLCESVWDVKPREVTRGRPVALVWLSPDCRHFSKAKGGTPVEKRIRGLAWVGMRWVATCKPRVVVLENVIEFTTWGPVIIDADGKARPDPKKKGVTFESFVRQLRAHGYEVDWRELRACDSGAPTIRRRLFLIARRDGLPIIWPTATHSDPESAEVVAGNLKPWRSAAECIDFNQPSRSIFFRKKDLVTNTRRRVAKGLWKHVLTAAKPFIVKTDNPAGSGPVLTPFIGEHANGSSQRNMPANSPLRTICAQVKGGHFSIIAPTLAPLRGTTEAHLGAHSIQAPLSTVAAGGTHHALVGAHLITIGYGERTNQAPRAQDIEKPLGTVVAAPKHTLVAACFEQANGGFYEGDGRPAEAPLSTITAAGSNQRLITAYCVKYYSTGGQWQGLAEPMHTLPTKGRMGLVQTIQVPAAALLDEHASKARECARLLHEYLPEHFPTQAEMVLVGDYVLVDITLRMLKPRELFRAQSFPETYIINEIPDPEMLFKDGKQIADPLSVPRIPLTATAQVRMCGNSVAPIQAEAIIRANFSHEQLLPMAA